MSTPSSGVKPTPVELLDQVSWWLEHKVAPQLADREKFLARVAVNALATVKREIEQGPAAEAAAVDRLRALLGRTDGDGAELTTALSQAIRDGVELEADALREHLRLTTLDRVSIDQPQYSGLRHARAARPD